MPGFELGLLLGPNRGPPHIKRMDELDKQKPSRIVSYTVAATIGAFAAVHPGGQAVVEIQGGVAKAIRSTAMAPLDRFHVNGRYFEASREMVQLSWTASGAALLEPLKV